MITFLKGTLLEKHPTRVVVDVAGVGYEVFIPLSSYDQLPMKNNSCLLLIYDHVREDCHKLFGFMTKPERAIFVLLMGTSGIGPKLALSALSGLSVREFRAAVVEGDVKRLSSISGVGRKMAERIVVDLRDKISEGEALEALAGGEETSERDRKGYDALLALIALGYKQVEAKKMLTGVFRQTDAADMATEEIIRKALGG